MTASTCGPIVQRAPAEFLALVIAQRAAADDGHILPCQADPDLFTSDATGLRLKARRDRADKVMRLCGDCPVLVECWEYADAAEERFHVWAGVDRGPKFKRAKTLAAETAEAEAREANHLEKVRP